MEMMKSRIMMVERQTIDTTNSHKPTSIMYALMLVFERRLVIIG